MKRLGSTLKEKNSKGRDSIFRVIFISTSLDYEERRQWTPKPSVPKNKTSAPNKGTLVSADKICPRAPAKFQNRSDGLAEQRRGY